MKRSSRLIILVGIILAIGAFAAILLLGNNGSLGTAVNQPTPTPMTTVVQAVADIPLGTAVTADQVHAVQVAAADVPAEAFTDPSQVIGHVVRRGIATGETLTSSDFASGTTATGDAIVKALKSGLRAMSIEVDQNTGVGTLIQPGDRVDIVIGLKIQQYIPGPNPSALPQAFPPDPQLSVKNIIQNVEVLGALLSTPTTSNTVQGQQQPAPSSAPNGGVGITGQQEIVIVAVTPQQAEVIKYAQVDATDNQDLTISLILRSPADASAPPDTTSGITLYQLIQKYGVLPPIPLLSSPTPR